MRAFSQPIKAINVEDPDNQHTIGCIANKGYDFTVAPAHCDGRYPLPTQTTSYVRSNWFDWRFFKLRG